MKSKTIVKVVDKRVLLEGTTRARIFKRVKNFRSTLERCSLGKALYQDPPNRAPMPHQALKFKFGIRVRVDVKYTYECIGSYPGMYVSLM